MGYISLFLLISVILGIFLVCRELMCWYWKINKSIENQEKIIGLLQQLVNKTSIKEPAVDINYAGLLGEHVQITQKNGLTLAGKVIQSEDPGKYISLLSEGNVKRIGVEAIRDVKITQ